MRPNEYPRFAELEQIDPVTKQNNVYKPPPPKQDYGWSYKEKGARQWFNWLHRLTYQWIKYLDETVGGYNATIEQLDQALANFNNSIAGFNQTLDSMSTDLNNLKTAKLNSRLTTAENKLQPLVDANLNSRLQSAENFITGQAATDHNTISSHEIRIATVENTINNTLTPAVNSHTASIGIIESMLIVNGKNTLITGVITLTTLRTAPYLASAWPARTMVLVSGIAAGTSGVDGGGNCLLYNDGANNWRSLINGNIIT